MRKSEPKKVLSRKSVAREAVVEKAEKSTPKKAPAAPKKEKKNESTITAELQYAGKAIPISDIIDRAKEACGNGDLNIYIKPEENKVYYVSGDTVGSFEI